jgi:hypothetical protein
MGSNNPKIIGVFGIEQNIGKATLSHALSKIIAENQHKVLFVELDYSNPSFANKTQIPLGDRHMGKFMEEAILYNQLNLENYIFRKKDIHSNTKQFDWLPSSLDLLVYPKEYQVSEFPDFQNDSEEIIIKFVEKLMNRIKSLDYDAVIFNLPCEIDDIFGLPILRKCEYVINVLNGSPKYLSRYMELTNVFEQADLQYKKWIQVFNLCSSNIGKDIYGELTELNISECIPYCNERAEFEFALKVGSPIIDLHLKTISRQLGFFIKQEEKKRGGINKLWRS